MQVRISSRVVLHYEHSTMVAVVGVCGVICQLSACLVFLLSPLLFVVTDFSAITVFHWVSMIAWFGVMTPLPPNSLGPFLSSCHWWELRSWFCGPWPNRPVLPRPCPLPPSKLEYSICPSCTSFLWRTWFSSTNNNDWRSKKEGGFSLVRTTDLIAPNQGAKAPRHIYTISSSSMMTLIELRASHSSLILKV